MRSFVLLGFASIFLLGACSDAPKANDAGDDAGIDAAPFAPASHPPAPNVTSSGGSVIASPKLVVVTFSDDPLASSLETFAQGIGKSSYWAATTSEYGVGPAQFGGAVHVPSPPGTTLTQDQLESWVASQLDGTHPEWPAWDASTIYSIVMPSGAGIMIDGAAPCHGSPAYHFEIDSGGKKIVYAAINRCDGFAGLKGIDYVTAGLSHEWIEASTDPLYITAPAYDGPPQTYNDWNAVTGGEVADFCTTTNTVYFKPADLPFTVQRSWSNAAASAGHDPCVPAPDGPYFAAAPVLPDTLHGTFEGQAMMSEGVHVALGASVTIQVDLFSDAPTDAPFVVSAKAQDGAALDFSWDTTSGQNGDVLNLTITRKADAPGSSLDFFQITAAKDGRQSAWIGALGN